MNRILYYKHRKKTSSLTVAGRCEKEDGSEIIASHVQALWTKYHASKNIKIRDRANCEYGKNLTKPYKTSYQIAFNEEKNYTLGDMIECELNELCICKENVVKLG
jgi:hypothetical protein